MRGELRELPAREVPSRIRRIVLTEVENSIQGEFEDVEQKFCEIFEKAQDLSNQINTLVSENTGENEDEINVEQFLEEIL